MPINQKTQICCLSYKTQGEIFHDTFTLTATTTATLFQIFCDF
jgi:hypothetical protein